ncbi:MAG: hypothetical protein DLM67_19865 [Candidatus Nephthysia bennettiae]|nr:MAG: hypothetical protein DLM67_19865 [Candidatus Dormibacteraeota bacterium]
MRAYQVHVVVDLDSIETAARLSERDSNDLLNEFAKKLRETGERLVASWLPEESPTVLLSNHQFVEMRLPVPDSGSQFD